MIVIYTSIECETDRFQGQIMKIYSFKILGTADQWEKNYHYFRSYKTILSQVSRIVSFDTPGMHLLTFRVLE